MTDKIRFFFSPENHIVGFLMNLFANYGGNKYLVSYKQARFMALTDL
jgi:hypothetical protein